MGLLDITILTLSPLGPPTMEIDNLDWGPGQQLCFAESIVFSNPETPPCAQNGIWMGGVGVKLVRGIG